MVEGEVQKAGGRSRCFPSSFISLVSLVAQRQPIRLQYELPTLTFIVQGDALARPLFDHQRGPQDAATLSEFAGEVRHE